MAILKRIFKWIGYLIGIWLVLIIAGMAWGLYREPIAKQEAKDFCATVKVGQKTDGLQEQALASGASEMRAKWILSGDGTRTMFVTFIGIPPFSRYSCVIKATDVVISAEYDHMD
jgi:hypothetical protein